MGKRKLIADDEPGIAGAIAYALGREGFEVSVAPDGEEALAAVAVFRPHVLQLDVIGSSRTSFGSLFFCTGRDKNKSYMEQRESAGFTIFVIHKIYKSWYIFFVIY